jgi:predicted small integral membrane protein
MAQQPPVQAPVQRKTRQGFLPISTNTFDRCFISVVIFVAITLLWLRFLEPLGAQLWISTVISVVLAVWIISKG